MNNVVSFKLPRQMILACKNDSREWMFNICTEDTFQSAFVDYYNPGCKFADLDEDSIQVLQTIMDDGEVTFEGDEGMYLLKDMEAVIKFFEDIVKQERDEKEWCENEWKKARDKAVKWSIKYKGLQGALKTALGDNAIQCPCDDKAIAAHKASHVHGV